MVKKNQLNNFDVKGVLCCARYAFKPYELKLCTPNDDLDFYACYQDARAHQDLNTTLKEFQTLYPYLQFIARANRIKDPFNEMVVEAYWIGNQLLENITNSELYEHLIEGIGLKKRLNIQLLRSVIDKIPMGARPHHNFHVLNIGKRTGNLDVMHTLKSMDLCRVSWGKIEKINQNNLVVSYQPLIFENNKLKLGFEINQEISYKVDDRGFIKNPEIGQWVSFHWGFVCEILDNLQVAYLRKYTQESIQLANFT